MPSDPSPSTGRHDFFEILRTLDRAGVDYVVIGGVAVQAYGRLTATKDIDVTTARESGGLVRLAAALGALDARPAGVDGERPEIDVSDPRQLAEAGDLALSTSSGPLDVLFTPAGAAPYGRLRERAIGVEVRGIVIPIAAREDLIAMKVAAGRPVDLDDLAVLTSPLTREVTLDGVRVEQPADWAQQILGPRPGGGQHQQRLWDRAAEGIYLFHTEFGAPGRARAPLEEAPSDQRQLRVWRRAVERVAEARDALSPDALPELTGDLADALDELGPGRQR